MNYLAHAYLSLNNPEILVGNMISDFVKGKKKFDYSSGIQKGIAHHRAIDSFTDNHPATKAAMLFFKPAYRLYSGPFVDIVFDHFLATDTNEFLINADLSIFCESVYHQLENNYRHLPQVFQKMFSYMKTQNWLYNYQYNLGVEKAFAGMVYRATYLTEYNIAFSVFKTHYQELKNCYNLFFPQVKQFAADKLSNLLSDGILYL